MRIESDNASSPGYLKPALPLRLHRPAAFDPHRAGLLHRNPTPPDAVEHAIGARDKAKPIPFADFLRRVDAREARPIPFADHLREADAQQVEAEPDPMRGAEASERAPTPDQSESRASTEADGWPRLGEVLSRPQQRVQQRVETVYRIREHPPYGSIVDVLI